LLQFSYIKNILPANAPNVIGHGQEKNKEHLALKRLWSTTRFRTKQFNIKNLRQENRSIMKLKSRDILNANFVHENGQIRIPRKIIRMKLIQKIA
jgi:hypothetical protein